MSTPPLPRGVTGSAPTARQSAQAMVSAAMAAHKAGDLALCEQLLIQALEFNPKEADALQLHGLLQKGKGDIVGAERLMRRSLEVNERQPHVHNNLANLLRGKGAIDEALRHYDRAIQLSPDYVDALTQFGETMSALGRYAEGEGPLRRAYRLKPRSVAAAIGLAFICGKTGRIGEAEAILRQGLAAEPDNMFYRNNLGQLLTHQLKFAEAVTVLAPLTANGLQSPEVHINFANALVGAGRLEEAVEHYLHAVNLDPLSYHAHDNLNNVLWQLGRREDVGKSFAFAKQAIPDHPDILEMSAECNITFGKLDLAEEELRQAERLRPQTIWQYRLWTALRLAQVRPAEAFALAADGVERNPDDTDLLGKLAEASFLANRPADALKAARRIAALDPVSQFAACYEATALRMLGDDSAARRIYDYDNFVRAVPLTPPSGFADMDAFNAVLREKLDELHFSHHEPVHQTLRNGTQTHESLFTRPGIDPAITRLGEKILAAAGDFMASLPDDPNHPFLRRKGAGMTWHGSWSVRLRDGGFHVDHVHGKGWISGAYYIQTPDCLADEVAKPGWIKFGEFQRQAGRTLPWEKAIRPRPGLLVMFPSYMLHGTVPIKGDQPRLIVSFDIIPADPS